MKLNNCSQIQAVRISDRFYKNEVIRDFRIAGFKVNKTDSTADIINFI